MGFLISGNERDQEFDRRGQNASGIPTVALA